MKKLFSICQRVIITTVAGLVLLVGCTTAQIQQAEAQIQTVITTATAVACGIIPTADSILAVVAVLYPGATLLGLAGPALQAVENEICTSAPPVASRRFRAMPIRGGIPVTIGQTQHGVVVTGWGAR